MAQSDTERLIDGEFTHEPREVLYVNHAAMSPWPNATRRAVEDFARENAERGPLAYADWLRQESALRERVAGLLNAGSAADIALLSNTSTGINITALGVDWRAGDNVVSAVGEFPSNQLAWAQLDRRGVELRQVDLRGTPDPELALLSAMDERTRVLTVSSVQWTDGFRLRLEPLGAACAAAGVLFFVDAIQHFGALPVDVRAAQVDCLAAGSHKWQMGPEGMGVFYCSPAARERLALQQFGWRMLENPYRFGPGEPAIADDARRFETGSPNTMGQVALLASLGVIERCGVTEIGRRVLDNSRRLFDAIEAIPGLVAISDAREERRSGIVTLRHERVDGVALNRVLKLGKVSAAVRGGGVRLSPHFYQHGAAMDRLLNVLEDAVRQL